MKIIPFDVDLKSTKVKKYSRLETVYTNDRSSVEVHFRIKDMTEAELSNATAAAYLYMRDGSFFQNDQAGDVTRQGTTFIHKIKEDQIKHSGKAEIQLIVNIGPGYATQRYGFFIEPGLDDKVAREVVAPSWNKLTTEAKAYIDQMKEWQDASSGLAARFDAAINETTTDTEVIDARMGQPTLRQKLLSVDQQLADNVARLNDNAISPDDFQGTDFERVQAALDYALENNLGVKFARMYDVTGHTLMINRPDLYYANDRKQLFLYGFGGGLTKNDPGFLFDAPFANAGDINVSYLKYHSVQGAGTKVWNGDKIIRVKSHGCEYRNVDTILSAINKYTQTMYFTSEHVTGGNGWKFEAKRFLDVVIDKCMVEDGEHFIRNTESLSIPMCNSLRITSNLIENMRGTTAILGGSYGLAITDNYIEYNGAYLDLDTLATNYPHIGLSIRGNTFYQLDSQIVERIPCIKLKNVTEASARGNGGCFSSGNSVAGSVLYDLTNMQRQSYLTGAGDFGEIINPSRYIQLGKPFLASYPDNFARKTHGNVTNYYKQFFITLVPSGADTVLDIPLPHFTLSKYAVVNVMYDSEWFVTKKMATDATNNKIKIVLTNTHPESALNVNPRVVITDHNLV